MIFVLHAATLTPGNPLQIQSSKITNFIIVKVKIKVAFLSFFRNVGATAHRLSFRGEALSVTLSVTWQSTVNSHKVAR